MLTKTNNESYRNMFPKNECGEIYVEILTNSIKETYYKFVENTDNDRISFAKFRGIELVGNEIVIKIFFQAIPENHNTMRDLGYEFNEREDTEFSISVPNDEVYDINFWKTAILNYDGWQEYTGINYLGYVREMFKILIEFFNKISE